MPDNIGHYKTLLEQVACNLCGADDYEVIYPPRYESAQPGAIVESFRASGDEILIDQLVRCRRCGLQYLNPRLREGLIIEGYTVGTDETFVSQVESRERTFSKCLDTIECIMPHQGRILDIGTAGGAFLGIAKKRGWQVAGCEPNLWLAEWGSRRYGMPIHTGTVFDMAIKDASFDVVTLWDVLEHTPDPKAVLMECHRVLKPGGLLVVNYPDIGSSVARLMGRRWVFLLSVHLYYFTLNTIKKVLEMTGFEPIKHKRHWQSLELGYILTRMKPYVPIVSGPGARIVKALGLEHIPVSYWMGQVLVLARRRA